MAETWEYLHQALSDLKTSSGDIQAMVDSMDTLGSTGWALSAAHTAIAGLSTEPSYWFRRLTST